jgi:DNA modification methylase
VRDDYRDFLKTKHTRIEQSGIDVFESEMNSMLFDFQKFIVRKALRAGKYALFSDTGTGKTIMQLEWGNWVVKHTNKPVLILTPLAVSGQTILEGKKFGYIVERYSGKTEPEIYVSNYEQLDNIDTSVFSGIILDESGILKNFSGKTKNKIINTFKNTRFKLACTATPAPNDHLELGNHAEFLNVMPSNEMIARFFINDTMHFGSYRLKAHAVRPFWEWVATWAMMMTKPSDIGFEHAGYDLPPLEIIEHQVDVDIKDFENGNLFRNSNVNATNFNAELRLTMKQRMQKAAEIASGTNDQVIVWVNQNAEADAIKKLIPNAVEVRGSEPPEDKEKKLIGFGLGEFRVLITKKKIAQFGLNYQNCHIQIFASLDFSFEGLYQAIRRSYRFGQKKQVDVHIITTETMENVSKAIKEKESAFNEMKRNMILAAKSVYQFEDKKRLELTMEFNHEVIKNEYYEMHLGDSNEVIKGIPDNSVDFQLFSPPFSNLYIYSESVRDMGNCKDDEEFIKGFEFLIPELKRILRPGRLVAVHVKNLVNYMNSHGKSGQRDFRGDIIRAFTKHDFSYHSEVTIWKDPVIEMQRTKAHGLLYKQLRADSSFSRNGMAEYLVIFRKWPENENDEKLVQKVNWKTEKNFKLEQWQEWASPVWMDIQQTNVLNIRMAKDGNDEKHICPLQLGIIERAVYLWTNPGDVVFSPFAGIGSEGYGALKAERKFVGIELKKIYFDSAIRNLNSVIENKNQLSFFDDEVKDE